MPEDQSTVHPVVAIPIYKTELSAAEALSIARTVDVLGHHTLYFIGPARLSAYLDALCHRYGPRVGFKTFDDRFFSGIAGYNSLMRSVDFYRSFSNHSYLLIAQTDALVVSDQLNHWCERGYSYIGAPWFVGGSEPRQPLEFFGVGNGGFSLRKLSDCLRVLSTPRRIPNFLKSRSNGNTGIRSLPRRLKHEWWFAYNVEPLFPSSNEDFFWGMLVPAVFPFFRVPKPEIALGFAFEVEPRLLYAMNQHELPFGCHAWERCDRGFWEEVLPWLKSCA